MQSKIPFNRVDSKRLHNDQYDLLEVQMRSSADEISATLGIWLNDLHSISEQCVVKQDAENV